MNETREQFQKRYPRPGSAYPKEYKRALVACTCGYEENPHWAWAFWYFDEHEGGLMGFETLAEDPPTPD